MSFGRLNSIIGFANLLIEAGLEEQQRQHFAKLVRDAGRSLLVIVNDVLDFSKIEAGKLTLDPSRWTYAIWPRVAAA